MAATFQEVFESIFDLHAPLRRKRVRSEFAPWLTPSLRNLMLERDRLKVQAEKSPEMWSAYKRKRNQVTNEMRISIRDYYHGLIEENIGDPKKMWRTINKVLDKDVNTVSLSSLEIDGKYLTRERDVVEAMKITLFRWVQNWRRRLFLSQVMIASATSIQSQMKWYLNL